MYDSSFYFFGKPWFDAFHLSNFIFVLFYNILMIDDIIYGSFNMNIMNLNSIIQGTVKQPMNIKLPSAHMLLANIKIMAAYQGIKH